MVRPVYMENRGTRKDPANEKRLGPGTEPLREKIG